RGAAVEDGRFLAKLAHRDLTVEGGRPAGGDTQVFLDPVLAAGLTGGASGPEGAPGPLPGVLGRIRRDALEGAEGPAEIACTPGRETHGPPVADLFALGQGRMQIVAVQ